MNKKRWLACVFSLFACLVSNSLPPVSAQQQQRPRVVAADPQISLALAGLDGRNYDLAQMRGNVVVVSFGATWCQPCGEELRALTELQHEYQSKPVKFLWVNIESQEVLTDARLKKYVKAHHLNFPVLRDPTLVAFGQFSRRVRLPMIVFFDRAGRPTGGTHVGFSVGDPENYKQFVRGYLDQLLGV
ncbi:MAG TPA: TlpA disulfide reductase family protein [Pyrinomonadaceae bacterium]|nr:TlpA disulfide reductase family protein [Pyrinomonadaceae bacterium]